MIALSSRKFVLFLVLSIFSFELLTAVVGDLGDDHIPQYGDDGDFGVHPDGAQTVQFVTDQSSYDSLCGSQPQPGVACFDLGSYSGDLANSDSVPTLHGFLSLDKKHLAVKISEPTRWASETYFIKIQVDDVQRDKGAQKCVSFTATAQSKDDPVPFIGGTQCPGEAHFHLPAW